MWREPWDQSPSKTASGSWSRPTGQREGRELKAEVEGSHSEKWEKKPHSVIMAPAGGVGFQDQKEPTIPLPCHRPTHKCHKKGGGRESSRRNQWVMPEKGVSVQENASLSTLKAVTTAMIMFTDPQPPPHRMPGIREPGRRVPGAKSVNRKPQHLCNVFSEPHPSRPDGFTGFSWCLCEVRQLSTYCTEEELSYRDHAGGGCIFPFTTGSRIRRTHGRIGMEIRMMLWRWESCLEKRREGNF